MDLTLFNALACLEKPDGVIALPGPENYVLAARPDHPKAMARLYRLKGNTEPLLLLGRDTAAFHPFIEALPEQAEGFTRRFWPGPLIILLDKRRDLPESFSQHRQVKVSQPENPFVLDFLSLNPGGLLATLCACRTTGSPARSAQAVHDCFGDDVDFVLADDDTLLESAAPTVVWVRPDNSVHLLRSGAIVLD